MTRKRILPPVYLLVAITAMIVLHFLSPVRKVIVHPYNYLGMLLVLLGLVANIWSGIYFIKRKTTFMPFERSVQLVTDGPFRLSRNPMYVGMVVMLIGVAVLLGSVTPWVMLPAFAVLIDRWFIVFEEKAMAETLGQEYLDYKQRVRRWI